MELEEMTGAELLAVFGALSNPHRMRIVAALSGGRREYVSLLARELGMSRPLLHMHLQKLQAAGLVTGELELSDEGKAVKYYQAVPFSLHLTPEAIEALVPTLPESAGEKETN